MRIQPVVEGHGELQAVPVLLRRLRNAAQTYNIDVNAPIRRKRSELVQEAGLRRSIRLARLQQGCRAILVLFDSDDDCPAELGPRLQQWAHDAAAPIPCVVVMAQREYEAWFLAAIESLRGVRGVRDNAESHPDPETPRDAKGQLEARMRPSHSYSETADQAALSARLDISTVYGKCRSFRKFVQTFGILVTAMDQPITNWPPVVWPEET